jgi:hypothetical protein
MSPKWESAGRKWFCSSSFAGLVTVLVVACLFTGCRRKATGPIAQEQTNLSWLSSKYGMYISQQGGRAPKTIDDLRKFVEATTTTEQLSRLKVAKAGDLFISPRDGKPFAMVSYDKFPPPVAGQPPPIVLYETVGQNGQRSIAFLGGDTQTVDESELQKMLPPQAKLNR